MDTPETCNNNGKTDSLIHSVQRNIHECAMENGKLDTSTWSGNSSAYSLRQDISSICKHRF